MPSQEPNISSDSRERFRDRFADAFGRTKRALFIFTGVAVLSGGWFLYDRMEVSPPKTPEFEFVSHPVGVTQAVESKKITLLFVGDIMLSRTIGKIMERTDDWAYHFSKVEDFLRAGDMTFGNLEGPISLRGRNRGSIYSFRADPRAAEGLKRAGFDVLSVANNHSWDYGPEAFLDTIEILERAGIRAVGGGRNYAEAHRPAVKNIAGTHIVFLAYTEFLPIFYAYRDARPASAFLDSEIIQEDIGEAREKADFVIVSLHWGSEYQREPSAAQKAVAHKLIDAGANLVIGHHPHVVQPVERYGEGVIAYSLGNFVFDQNFSPDTRKGLLLRVILQGKKIIAVDPLSIEFDGSYRPSLKEDQYVFATFFPSYPVILWTALVCRRVRA